MSVADGTPPEKAKLGSLTLSMQGVSPARGEMPDAVAAVLRESILDAVLPAGTWLREAEVAQELKVSRTPVRDAFRILANEGLVEIKANQGAVVTQITSDDILAVYLVREALEGLAFRLATRHAARQCLDSFSKLIPQMREAGDAGDLRRLSRTFMQFHRVVCDASGNQYLVRSLGHLQNAARRFPDPSLSIPGRMEEAIQEHVDLAEAVANGDAEQAEELAVQHMRNLSEARIRVLLRG